MVVMPQMASLWGTITNGQESRRIVEKYDLL